MCGTQNICETFAIIRTYHIVDTCRIRYIDKKINPAIILCSFLVIGCCGVTNAFYIHFVIQTPDLYEIA